MISRASPAPLIRSPAGFSAPHIRSFSSSSSTIILHLSLYHVILKLLHHQPEYKHPGARWAVVHDQHGFGEHPVQPGRQDGRSGGAGQAGEGYWCSADDQLFYLLDYLDHAKGCAWGKNDGEGGGNVDGDDAEDQEHAHGVRCTWGGFVQLACVHVIAIWLRWKLACQRWSTEHSTPTTMASSLPWTLLQWAGRFSSSEPSLPSWSSFSSSLLPSLR